MTGPPGPAHLRTGHTGPILAVAGGSGLAPILESAVAKGMRQPIRVYVGDGRSVTSTASIAQQCSRRGMAT